MMESLDQIGRRLQCDKSSLVHGFLDAYEAAFARFTTSMPVILEIGWSDTSSLDVWATYFDGGKVVGSFSESPASATGRHKFHIEIGDPADIEYLTYLIQKYDPDIVIDDSSHRWRQQKISLKTIIPLIKPKSIYVIEDLHTSFSDIASYGEGSDIQSSTSQYLQDLMAGLMSGGQAVKSGTDGFQRFAPDLIESVDVHKKICFITRNTHVPRQLSITPSIEGERRLALDNGGPYSRIPAYVEGVDRANQEQFIQQTRSKEVLPPPAFVSELRHATIFGRGVVATDDDQLLAPSLINVYGNEENFESLFRPQGSNRVLAIDTAQSPAYGGTRPVVLLKQRWDSNYGHWLVESLPRLAVVRQCHALDECDFMIGRADKAMSRVYLDSLELAGVRRDQILVTDDAACHVTGLVYPHPLTVQPWVKAPLVVSFLEEMRDRVAKEATKQSEKLFVRRSLGSRRKLLNENQILTIAEKCGFNIISIDGMNLRQQISAFSKAKLIVGTLGAELTNMCFSERGVSLFGLSPSNMQDDFYYDLTCLKGGKYYSLHGTPMNASNGLESDFTVDETRFEAILNVMLKQ